jgi:hypothetical protein
MSGSVIVSRDLTWDASTGIFFWVVETFSRKVHDDVFADQLWALSDNNIKWLVMYELEPDQQRQLAELIPRMPQIVREELPGVEYREQVALLLTELVDMVASVYGTEGSEIRSPHAE